MINHNSSKKNLNDIPYETEQSFDEMYFLDTHSILKNNLTFLYLLFFLSISIFIIYKCINAPALNTNFLLTDACRNIAAQTLSVNFTKIPIRNAYLTIKAKLYSTVEYKSLGSLFKLSVSPKKQFFSSISFSNSSIQQTKETKFISNNEFVLSKTIFTQDISLIDFIYIQGYFSNSIQNITKAIFEVRIMHNIEYNFIFYSNLFFLFTIIFFIIIKTKQMKNIEELRLNQFIPLLYLSFCAASLIPTFYLNPNHLFLIQKTSEAYLSTIFLEISFSFNFFTIYSLPFSFFESFFDFFLSVLILFYSFFFEILNIKTKETNPTILLAILFALYLIRNFQKGFFWFRFRTNESFKRGSVYTFVNIIVTSLIISCDFLISTTKNEIILAFKFVSLVTYGISMTLYNFP